MLVYKVKAFAMTFSHLHVGVLFLSQPLCVCTLPSLLSDLAHCLALFI